MTFSKLNVGDLFVWRGSVWMKATEHTATNFNHPRLHGITSFNPDTEVETA
jgi:hypothetical protein